MTAGAAGVLTVHIGTMNTTAALTDHTGLPVPLPLSRGGTTMSSGVCLRSPTSIDVGDAALDVAAAGTGQYVAQPVAWLAAGYRALGAGDGSVPVQHAFAAILQHIVGCARGRPDSAPPRGMVLTHPQHWPAQAVAVLVEAAALIGYTADRVRTVSEPIATAHFLRSTYPAAAGARLIVADIGAATLDIAGIVIDPAGAVRVAEPVRGLNGPAGDEFDNAVRRWVEVELSQRHPQQPAVPAATPGTDWALMTRIRVAKERLSQHESAEITVPGTDVVLVLTRIEFERLIAPESTRIQQILRAADPGGVHIVLTGGSAAVPAVRGRLAELGQITVLDDPGATLAQGAVAAVPTLSPTVPPAPHRPASVEHGAAPKAEPRKPKTRPAPNNPNLWEAQRNRAGSEGRSPAVDRGRRVARRHLWVIALVIGAVVVAMVVIGVVVSGVGRSSATKDARLPAVTVEAKVPVAQTASKVAADSATIFIANHDGSLWKLDRTSKAVSAVVQLGGSTMLMAIDGSSHTAYLQILVDGWRMQLVKVDGATNAVEAMPETPGTTITAIAADPTSHILYAGLGNRSIVTMDPVTKSVETMIQFDGTVSDIVLDGPNTLYALVTEAKDSRLVTVDRLARTMRSSSPIGDDARALAVDPAEHLAYFTVPATTPGSNRKTGRDIKVFDPASQKTLATIADPADLAEEITLDPASHTAYVVHFAADAATVIDTRSRKVVESLDMKSDTGGSQRCLDTAADPDGHVVYAISTEGKMWVLKR
ncbi:hypothetical protein [Nocardia sp. alder85J]|uniref:hypothetical protein n=1 Tax=Nocardia sp. alder85J TaxID=2862949 RepID=UPI001CD7B71B|nr:hypothetical protein [Nocardia sp. alder85J]MCX4093037.1 hypothetical protein [Nocardia sp. alder85J]